MDEPQFATSYKFLLHTTTAENLQRIKTVRRIESASVPMRAADPPVPAALHRTRRKGPVELTVGGVRITLRDQLPLREGHISCESSWGLPHFIELLNGLVFFWSDSSRGRAFAKTHLDHYPGDPVLRVRTDSMFALAHPKFAWCNSGGPRTHPTAGKGHRGGSTFLPAGLFPRRPGEVAEVVFENHAPLPDEAEVGSGINGPWVALWP